jgi:uncharacterized membrane protein
MRRRRDTSVSHRDRRPEILSLEDQRRAERLLKEAFARGELDKDECSRRMGLVYRAVTPRDLWKASGHRAGSPKRSDRAELWRAVRLQIAIVAFAIVIMVVIVLGTIIYQQGGTAGTPVFPWEWGQD